MASQSWGTVDLGGESFRFLVLGCRIGTGARDSLFVSGAGEAPDGRPLEVELERSLQDDRVLERASILFRSARVSAGRVNSRFGETGVRAPAETPERAGAAPGRSAGGRWSEGSRRRAAPPSRRPRRPRTRAARRGR